VIALLRQIWAILVITYKRLLTQPSLAIATTVGLTTAVALVLSVPLYADATQFRLLRAQLMEQSPSSGGIDEKGAADYAPLSYIYHFDGSQHDGPQWADGQPLDQYFVQTAGADLGLPTLQMIRRFRTDSLQIFPPLEPNNPKSKYYITWANFGTVNDLEHNIRLMSGTFPTVADASPDAPVEVLVYEGTADKLAIDPGNVYTAKRDDVEVPIRVTGIWAPSDPTLSIWDLKSQETFLVPEETYAKRIADTVQDELLNSEWQLIVSGSQLHANDIDGLLKRMDRVSNNVTNLLTGTKLNASPFNALAAYQKNVPTLTLLLFAFSAPILGLILVFVGLVAGLYVSQQRNEIAILRSRGATLTQVAAMAALQGLTLGLIALVVGVPIGMLIAQAIGRSRSFLDFGTPANLRVILTPSIFAFGVLAIVIVLLFQFIVPTLNAARNTIITYKQERARALRQPWWQRMWLDLLLLIIAGLGAYSLYNQRVLVVTQKIQVPDPLQNPALLLVPSLGIFALTLFVLRLMPALMATLARLMTRTRSVGMLTAARYLARTPAFYNAPLVLLIFTLSLSAFTASIAQTLDHHLTRQMYYETGTDMSLQDYGNTYNSEDNLTPIYTFAPLEDYRHVPGITAASPVGRYPASLVKVDGTSQSAVYLGVDRTTFPQVTYWQPSFSPATLGALMNALAQYPNGVLVSRDFMKEQNLKLGDYLTVSVQGNKWATALKVIIVGVVDLFPSWYPEKGALVVGNLDYLFNQVDGQYPHELWLTTTPKANPEDIVYAVRGYTIVIDQSADQKRLVQDGLNTFIKGWASATQKIISEQRRPERQGLFGLLSVGFVTAALLTVLGFILYAMFSFRRRFIELGMLRAVGLSARQMTALLASELIFLIAIGLLVGTALGVLFSRWFIPFLQVGASLSAHYPPFNVEVAWLSIVQMYVLFGLLFIGALSVLAALLMRMKIFQAIKLGETT
jgi:putative ABC transport system permease protein